VGIEKPQHLAQKDYHDCGGGATGSLLLSLKVCHTIDYPPMLVSLGTDEVHGTSPENIAQYINTFPGAHAKIVNMTDLCQIKRVIDSGGGCLTPIQNTEHLAEISALSEGHWVMPWKLVGPAHNIQKVIVIDPDPTTGQCDYSVDGFWDRWVDRSEQTGRVLKRLAIMVTYDQQKVI
jgi:hypothetical protein